MRDAIKLLVKVFDCPWGVSEEIYEGTSAFVLNNMGACAAQVFVNAVNATDGCFYISEGTAESLFNEMEAA